MKRATLDGRYSPRLRVGRRVAIRVSLERLEERCLLTAGPAPDVVSRTPAPGASGVPVSSSVTATFNEAVQPGTISFTLKNAAGVTVAASVAYDSTTHKATLTPSSPLAYSRTYTATLSGAQDTEGDPMSGSVTWSFITAAVSIWSSTATPAHPSAADNRPIEVGVTFSSDVPGALTGIRFYKGSGNTGTHVADLWTSTGTLLASAIFTSETASGWQQVNFAQPVAITAGTTYVASYHTDVGDYAYSQNYFASQYDSGPLHVPASGGVYAYGPAGSFPAQTWHANNYWVDILLAPSVYSTTPPAVTSESPAPGATGVAFSSPVSATFNEAVHPGTISFTLKTSAGAAVPATIAYDSSTHTATLTPRAPLAYETTYTATVSGARSSFGVAMGTPVSWSFTTADVSIWSSTATPAAPSAGDPDPVELGVKFYSDVAGYITGLRFYKGSGNTGTHVGHLWSSDGTLLAAAIFTNETATGWQQVTFSGPVAISPHTVYVASYHTEVGHYAADNGYFSAGGIDSGPLHAPAAGSVGGNGVYLYGAGGFPTSSWNATNYWVDVQFAKAPNPDTLPPTVISESPAPGTLGVPVNELTPTVVLSEPMRPASISFILRDSDNNVVPASVTYDPSTLSVTLIPSAIANPSSRYTATLAGVKDRAGNPLSAPVTWSFTTGDRIVTSYNSIPYFGAHPTIVSTRSGPWSDPHTWSGGRVPSSGDKVMISPGTNVIYDLLSTAVLKTVTIQSGGTLRFRTDINTEIIAANYLVLPGGTLQVGTQADPVASNVKAQILIADQPLNTALDPEQYGDSLIGLGTVTMYGAYKTPFGQLSTEPHAGDTILTFSSPVTGWRPGDELYLPDTRQLDWNQRGSSYVPQWETPTIASISSNGLIVTLTSPIRFSHMGARDGDGVLRYLAQVPDETRNVVIASQNGRGNRGIVMFLQRAKVDIHSAYFFSLGRTTSDAFDDTTFNSTGQVTHIGTNQRDRTPVNFLNLWGPTTPQADGYQYTFVDNVVDCKLMDQNHIWGIEVNNSSYGLIQGNVVDNWTGAGISLVNGTEVGNMISGNFVMRINGTGNRSTTGLDGLGYWSFDPDNAFVNNVATNINQGGNYSYGFNINAEWLGTVRVPAYQGADPSLAGQSTLVNMNALPLRQFSGNEVYGATPNGLSLWWIGAFYRTPMGNAGTVANFLVWHQHCWGYFGYETNNLTISGFTALGDPNVTEGISMGMWFSDYMQQGLNITNADIQGERVGIAAPEVSDGPVTITNSYFRDATDVLVTTMGSVNGADGLPAKATILQNDRFAALPGYPLIAIAMDYETLSLGAFGSCDLIQSDQVFVYNYNGVSGDNFRVYYNQQVASFVVPQTNSLYQGLIGSPVAGLTNQQNWNQYGIAIAGAVAPSNSTTRAGIIGLVAVLPTDAQSASALIASSPLPASGVTASGGALPATIVNPSRPATPARAQNTGGSLSNTEQSVATLGDGRTSRAQSGANVRRPRGAQVGVVAGPLALTVARRNHVLQPAASPLRSELDFGPSSTVTQAVPRPKARPPGMTVRVSRRLRRTHDLRKPNPPTADA